MAVVDSRLPAEPLARFSAPPVSQLPGSHEGLQRVQEAADDDPNVSQHLLPCEVAEPCVDVCVCMEHGARAGGQSLASQMEEKGSLVGSFLLGSSGIKHGRLCCSLGQTEVGRCCS